MAKKQYYAVKRGKFSGVYNTWEQCEKMILGFSGAEHKKFNNKHDAELYVYGGAAEHEQLPKEGIHIYTNGSYKNNKYAWAFIILKNDNYFNSFSGIGSDEEMLEVINFAGELTAVIRAVEWALLKDIKPITIHHEFTSLSLWANGKWNATKTATQKYCKFMSEHRSWVNFNKVVGKCGITGNEMTRKLADKTLKTY